jgi:tRNA-specific 2-thiouridylase
MQTNTLWVVQGHEHPWLQSSLLTAQNASWVAGVVPAQQALAAKTRYRQNDAPCQLLCINPLHFSLQFTQPQWAVTPGQSAVLYDGEICMGGGVIATAQTGE